MHKTGSSYLQSHLRRVSPSLASLDWSYLFTQLDLPVIQRLFKPKGYNVAIEEAQEELHLALARSQNNVVISGEDFSSAISNEEKWDEKVFKLKTLLANVPNFTIVIYVRRQDVLFESAYQQLAAVGLKQSFSDFQKKFPPLKNLNWERKIGSYIKAFGSGSVHVKLYENEVQKGDLFLRFADLLGMDVRQYSSQVGRRVNSGNKLSTYIRGVLGAELTSDAYAFLRRHLKDETAESELLGYGLFDLNSRLELLESYRAGNETIARLAGADVQVVHKWEEDINSHIRTGSSSSRVVLKAMVALLEETRKGMIK